MFFRIATVATDRKLIELSSPSSGEDRENIFTLVVGQNATGKSRLLRKVVSQFIFKGQGSPRDRYIHNNPGASWKYYGELSPHQDVVLDALSIAAPTNVIAVSTGRHDRFPSPNYTRKNAIITDYHYIAPSGGGSLSSLTPSLIAIIEGLQDYDRKSDRLAEIFTYLDFAPIMDIKFAFDTSGVDPYWKKTPSRNVDLLKDDLFLHSLDPVKIDIMEKYSRFHDYASSKNKFNLEINLSRRHIGEQFEVLSDLVELLKAGLVRISDLTLSQLTTGNRLRLSQASSGQQCMLTMILGIAGAIQHGSLICIDEPEISLHPKWQEDIIAQLQAAFSDYKGCHFIIATHSPQIVSGLTTSNGFVLSLEDNKLYHSGEYAKKSADYQLAQIFRAPGQGNEYLIRLALTLLSKLAKRERLGDDDLLRSQWLMEIQSEISDTDPVWHLIEQVRILGA